MRLLEGSAHLRPRPLGSHPPGHRRLRKDAGASAGAAVLGEQAVLVAAAGADLAICSP